MFLKFTNLVSIHTGKKNLFNHSTRDFMKRKASLYMTRTKHR